MVECPKDLICFTEDEWFQFLNEYEVDIIDEVGGLPTAPTGDAQAAIDYAKEHWDEAEKVSTEIHDEDYLVKRQERSWDDGILQLEL